MRISFQRLLLTLAMFAVAGSARGGLLNPSFEDTNSSFHWTAGTDATGPSPGRTSTKGASDGDYAIQFYGDASGPAGYIFQTFATTPGWIHKLSLDGLAIGSGTDMSVRVTVTGTSGILSDTLVTGMSSSGWQTFDAGSFFGDGSMVTLRLQEDSVNSGSRAPVIDNIVIDLVPEPSALLLATLGLSFTLLPRRRRRRRCRSPIVNLSPTARYRALP